MTTATATRWSWTNEPELMDRLRAAQNSGAFDHQDIMTIAGMFSNRGQLVAHVEYSEGMAARKGRR